MRPPLPPLSAVRVFEAAARHKSFTRAADELGMTQAAVSYQVKVLEDRAGGPLFQRLPRGVELTDMGARFSVVASDALDKLSDGFSAAVERSEETLVLSVISTFATNILAQRLGRFQIANPNIAVRVDVNQALANFESGEVDMAIRLGTGDWPGLKCHKLFPAVFTPMLSPKLAESIGGIYKPSDILKLTIIEAADPWWKRWFEAAGIKDDRLQDRPKLKFSSQILEANAAIAGQGVGILTPIFYRDAVAQGLLYQPFDLTCDTGTAVWLVYPESRRNSQKIRLFLDWMNSEIEELLSTAAPGK